MDIKGDKVKTYEELIHGDSIALDDLYNVFLECSIKTGQTSLTEDVYFVHDVSNLGITYNTLVFSSTQLPILTTSTSQELMTEYNDTHQQIFQKVSNTLDLYHRFEQKSYKKAMIDKHLIFMPLNGTVRKNTSFINPMYVTNFHKLERGRLSVNFKNYMGIDLDYGCRAFSQRMNKAVTQHVTYFFPEAYDLLEEHGFLKGDYLMNRVKHCEETYHMIDEDRLQTCRKKVDYFLVIQQFNQSLTIREFIDEYDSYWDKI